MKILSLYLPAFHRVKINDDVWGPGFTEWDNVKSGIKLYKNHDQPLVPLNNNYYDLSDKKCIEEQINIANKYNVDGFIFYHYWFGDGIQALEKPAEILRDNIDSKIDYCFCWANQSWFTTWHGKSSKIIVEQKYGNKNEWKKHIEYMLKFFKDERYLKINNRPVLYIYNMSDIKCIDEMINLWNNILNENGFDDIYIVEFISSKNKNLSYKNSDAIVEFEPLYTTYFDISKFNLFKRLLCKKFKLIDFQDYNKLWNYIINRKRRYNNKNIQKGCFVGWDNSARKGKNSMIIKNGTPSNFKKNLQRLIDNNRPDTSNDFLVINAWNKWSEGAMLEPTEKYKYKYLEAIKEVVDNYKKRMDD